MNRLLFIYYLKWFVCLLACLFWFSCMVAGVLCFYFFVLLLLGFFWGGFGFFMGILSVCVCVCVCVCYTDHIRPQN